LLLSKSKLKLGFVAEAWASYFHVFLHPPSAWPNAMHQRRSEGGQPPWAPLWGAKRKRKQRGKERKGKQEKREKNQKIR
jgi:hypothetical protein